MRDLNRVDCMVNVNQHSGWLCPKCGKANAPSVTACNHAPIVTLNAGICFIGAATEPLIDGELQIHTK